MKYLVFVICCLALAYAEEVKLGLQRLSANSGRRSQSLSRSNGGRLAQQRLTNGNGNFRPVPSASANVNGLSNFRQTRAGLPVNFAGGYGANYAGQYGGNFVGQYSPFFGSQAQFGRGYLPVNSYVNPPFGRQAVPQYAVTGFNPNPAVLQMAQEVASFPGYNIPWSALIQQKLDTELSLGLQPILGRSFYGSSVGAVGQQPFFGFGRQVLPGVYGLGQFSGALPYGQGSYRPTTVATGQQLFGRTGFNPLFSAYARRK